MAIVNCTPHPITIRYNVADAETEVTFPPSGICPRLKTDTVVEGFLSLKAKLPIVKTEMGEVEGLPEPNGDVFIVSTMVAQACNRYDLVSPDTGPTAIRENGQVKAVIRFQSFGKPWS